MSLDDWADLWCYWQQQPPVHVSVHALVTGLGGGGWRAAAPRPAAGAQGSSAMEGVAAILGPPSGRFVPPCRMEPPPQASATDEGS